LRRPATGARADATHYRRGSSNMAQKTLYMVRRATDYGDKRLME